MQEEKEGAAKNCCFDSRRLPAEIISTIMAPGGNEGRDSRLVARASAFAEFHAETRDGHGLRDTFRRTLRFQRIGRPNGRLLYEDRRQNRSSSKGTWDIRSVGNKIRGDAFVYKYSSIGRDRHQVYALESFPGMRQVFTSSCR